MYSLSIDKTETNASLIILGSQYKYIYLRLFINNEK